MEEIWKDIPGYEGYYMASNMGRIMSLPRVTVSKLGHQRNVKRTILSDFTNGNEYISIILRKDGKATSFRAHRLVMKAFHGDSELIIDHINGQRNDNRLSNLRYCTHRENSHFSFEKIKGSSKYIGVSFVNSGNLWRASIRIKSKPYTIGLFKTEIEAHNAYQKALKDWEEDGLVPDYEVRVPNSKYVGVSFHTSNKKWIASIKINKKHYNLGGYQTEEEAYEARNSAEKDYKERNIIPNFVNPKLTSKYQNVHKKKNGKWQATLLKSDNPYGGLFNTEDEAAERVREHLGLTSIKELLR